MHYLSSSIQYYRHDLLKETFIYITVSLNAKNTISKYNILFLTTSIPLSLDKTQANAYIPKMYEYFGKKFYFRMWQL